MGSEFLNFQVLAIIHFGILVLLVKVVKISQFSFDKLITENRFLEKKK